MASVFSEGTFLVSQCGFDKTRFQHFYRQSIEDVFRYWTPAMQAEISRHCYPWREGVTDFKSYLIASELRYEIACRSLYESGGCDSLCDVGGFFGVFPLTLARMGHRVAMTEARKYYTQSFDPLFEFLSDCGIQVIDYDPFDSAPPLPDKFDVVTVMAVLEHYPHSLRGFMENVLQMLQPGGRIYIEVPNIAYWPKRKALMQGKTPLVHAADIYHSSVPYIGHHHEYTLDELQVIAGLNGLEVFKINYFNYSFRGPLINRLYSDFALTIMSLIPSMRECVAILARHALSTSACLDEKHDA